jgi:hypothetical protein
LSIIGVLSMFTLVAFFVMWARVETPLFTFSYEFVMLDI